MKDLEDDEREFPIRVYTKVELALLYAPHMSVIQNEMETFFNSISFHDPTEKINEVQN